MIDVEETIDFVTDKKSYYYKYFTFTEDKDAIDYKVSFSQIGSTYFYKRWGIDNDYRVIFSFEILNGCWFLVSIED